VHDATRVAPGFTFQVPNPLAAEVDRLQAESAESAREENEAEARADRLEAEAEGLRRTAGWTAVQRDRLALFEQHWALAMTALLGMALALLASVLVTVTALRLRKRAVAYADDLAHDLEAKRALHLVERQRTGKELIALEERVRELEGQLQIRAQAS
jgi:sensor c-di-GMP phosphodiesterase-like protein